VVVDLLVEPAFKALSKRAPPGCREAIERASCADRRLKQGSTRGQAGKNMALPGDRKPSTLLHAQCKNLIRRFHQRAGAAVEFLAKPALGGGQQHALVRQSGRRIDAEFEAGEMTDRLGTDADFTFGRDRHWQDIGAAGADVADKDSSAAINEALG
jgi:hypothetical protein